MSDMSLDIPIQYDGKGKAPADALKTAEEQVAELEREALAVTRVIIPEAGPAKYFIRFTSTTPMYKTRLRLEELQYDVGNKMQQSELSFYATKRVEKKEGWGV